MLRGLTLLSLSCCLVVPGHAAHAAPTGWTLIPWTDKKPDPDDALAIKAASLPERRDALAALWDHPTQQPLSDQLTNALGDPILVERRVSHWRFDGLDVESASLPDLEYLELRPSDEAPPNRPMPALASLPFPTIAALATGTCDQALAALGRPSMMVGGNSVLWSTYAGARHIGVLLECSDTHLDKLTIIARELSPATISKLRSRGGTMNRDALPAGRFEPLLGDIPKPARKARDPRTLWPRGLAPGMGLDSLIAKLGMPPHQADGDGDLSWSYALVAHQENDGRISQLMLRATGVAFARNLGIDNDITATLGKSPDTLGALLGAPTTRDARKDTWTWLAGDAEITLEASIGGDVIQAIAWKYEPPPELAKLACRDALEAKPTPPEVAPPTGPFLNALLAEPKPVMLPFAIAFDASPQDLLRLLGPPRRCTEDAETLEYRGIELAFASGHLMRGNFAVDDIRPAGGARSDPFFQALRGGYAAIVALVGPPADSTSNYAHWVFERTTEKVHVHMRFGKNGRDAEETPSETPPLTAHALSLEMALDGGFDFRASIAGLSLARLEETAQERFGAGEVTSWSTRWNTASSGEVTMRADEGLATLTYGVSARAFLAKNGVSGPLVHVLGAPWTEALRLFGPATRVSAEDDLLKLDWFWPDDPLNRLVSLECRGTTPLCTGVLLRGPSTKQDGP